MMSLRVFCIGPLGSIEPSRMSWSSVSTAPRSAGRVRKKALLQKGEELAEPRTEQHIVLR